MTLPWTLPQEFEAGGTYIPHGKRYPAGEITPAGWWHLVNGTRPLMQLKAYDGSITFMLTGGLAPPFHDPLTPECVELKSLKGLIPPWRHIMQKGATQDGSTHIDAIYDPTEIELAVECVGKGWRRKTAVVRDLIASIDAKQQSELGFFDRDAGYWWSMVRWYQGAPPDALNIVNDGQQLSLRLLADDALWRSYDHTSSWGYTYVDMTEEFSGDSTFPDANLGPNWPLRYSDDTGNGFIYQSGGLARWKDDPDDWLLTSTRAVVAGPYKDFHTATDNQVVSMEFGRMQEWSLPAGSANDLWARMGRDPVTGAWDGNGIRLRIENNVYRLSRFVNFEHTLLRTQLMLIPPLVGETFTLVAGFQDNPRLFKVYRNGASALAYKERTPTSMLGVNFRGIGFGMQAGGAIITQATPGFIRNVKAGDNNTVSQSGWLERFNVGDQPMYDDYTLFGPGTFKIYDGPGSSEFVEFGPLLDNQVVMLRTDPRSNTTLVQDLTTVPPTPQGLSGFQQAVRRLISFFSARNAFTDHISSLFGIRAPQGNLYKYLKGRFSDNSAIPPKSPGNPAAPYYVKVEIDNGNADSRIIASGTPKRRYPL